MTSDDRVSTAPPFDRDLPSEEPTDANRALDPSTPLKTNNPKTSLLVTNNLKRKEPGAEGCSLELQSCVCFTGRPRHLGYEDDLGKQNGFQSPFVREFKTPSFKTDGIPNINSRGGTFDEKKKEKKKSDDFYVRLWIIFTRIGVNSRRRRCLVSPIRRPPWLRNLCH